MMRIGRLGTMRQARMVAGIFAATIAAVGLAACRGGSSGSADLGRELDAATGDSMGFAPNRGGTQFVSAIEQTPGAVRAPNAPVRRAAAVVQPLQPAVPTTAPAQVAKAPVVAPLPAPVPTPTPAPTPTPTPRRPGGYSTMGDIIRKAPFPINPATTARKPH